MVSCDYDLCVIGGGINGVGIARDAAGRGLSVLLVEALDLGGATSSASTKLIHGGLRYLEYFEFRLVREALIEREMLLRAAPHIIRPMKFVLPHDRSLRPAWMLRAGLFLYDHLGGRKLLPKSGLVDLGSSPWGKPLRQEGGVGFVYSDCWVDDARLVALNAMDAAARGADIRTRTACTALQFSRADNGWTLGLKDIVSGEESAVSAGMVVNAAGPWVRSFLDSTNLSNEKTPGVRLVKGSHIVVPSLFGGDQAYLLQQPDKRVVFAIPYEQKFTLVGTTEEDFSGDPAAVEISQAETDYLLRAVNDAFCEQVSQEDIIWTYSGVRPLLDSGQENATAVTRDYTLHMDDKNGPPLLSVFGGKITTYRVLAEHAVDMLLESKGEAREHWTAGAHLPGGDIEAADFECFIEERAGQYQWLPLDLLYRYARSYGTRMEMLLEGCNSLKDLGIHYGDHVYEAEIRYLMEHEFARSASDILWRRSKLGLHISHETARSVEASLSARLKEQPVRAKKS